MSMVSDIEKLRPELLEKSDAELERLRNEIEMAIAEKHKRAEQERRAAIVAEASKHVDAVVAGLKWLHDNQLLSDKMVDVFTRGDGQFNPATYIRAPRGVDDVRAKAVTIGGGEKKRRRRRDPVTGQLVPSKAAVAAGEA
ncbi:hypothetical protein [Mesorhizobium retamae]|uniref:Uncharacterized protein n=1 Tax=Mesorhizobium retamae TaxID=2912854 RepID=A0ABS9QHZ2_9HYPH|nr:hypothetical protein [Mesorhizobium sp. IRAMC:0171]MCG7507031.1 hypothetical protein [Mesorhizobium sp. IRAMC:0171]